MPSYVGIAISLTEQLNNDNFGWTERAEQTFIELKQAMIKAYALVVPDLTRPFIIETDASGYGLGVVLIQGQQPVAFFIQTLGPQTRLKSIYENELMVIKFIITTWQLYLLR